MLIPTSGFGAGLNQGREALEENTKGKLIANSMALKNSGLSPHLPVAVYLSDSLYLLCADSIAAPSYLEPEPESSFLKKSPM